MSTATTPAARDVLAERQRQISAEGWTPEHDDMHKAGSLASAAACYVFNAAAWLRSPSAVDRSRYADLSPISWRTWPWAEKWWKPKNERRDLVKAGALILAEIERLDRAAGIAAPPTASALNDQLQLTVSTASVLTGQLLVMAVLLDKALRVVKNVEAEGDDEEDLLQDLIASGETAIATVLTEHAMKGPSHG